MESILIRSVKDLKKKKSNLNYLKEKENISTQETKPLKDVTKWQEQEQQLIQMSTGITTYFIQFPLNACWSLSD